jgi:hypothetical protein
MDAGLFRVFSGTSRRLLARAGHGRSGDHTGGCLVGPAVETLDWWRHLQMRAGTASADGFTDISDTYSELRLCSASPEFSGYSPRRPRGRCRSLPRAPKRTRKPLHSGPPVPPGPRHRRRHSGAESLIPILTDAIRMPCDPAAQPPPQQNATWRPSGHPSAPRPMTAMRLTRSGSRPPLTAHPSLPPSTGAPDLSAAQPSRRASASRGHARTWLIWG